MHRFILFTLVAAITVMLVAPLGTSEAGTHPQTYNPVVMEAQLNTDWPEQNLPRVNSLMVDVQSSVVVLSANINLESYDAAADVVVVLSPYVSEALTVNWNVVSISVNNWAANETMIAEINALLVDSYIRYLRTLTIAFDVTDVTLVGSAGLNPGDAIHYTLEDTGERRWQNREGRVQISNATATGVSEANAATPSIRGQRSRR